MRPKSGFTSPFLPKAPPAIIPAVVVNELLSLFKNGQWPALASKADTLTRQFPGNPLAWRARGKALLQMGKAEEAANALQRAITLSPKDADSLSDLGQACGQLGRWPEAEKHHRRVLSMQPDATVNHNNLGTALRALHKHEQARVCFEKAVALHPDYMEAWLNLGLTELDLQRLDKAHEAFSRALRIAPNSPMALRCMGRLLTLLDAKSAEAIACLERAAALEPDNPDVHIDLGNALLKTNPPERHQACFRRAQALRPLVTWPANKGTPDFNMLLLDTPGSGSTPVRYLLGDAGYNRHFYCVLPDAQPDDTLLRDHGQVVLNMIADADNGDHILPHAQAVADRLGLPTINHPRLIMQTDRETVSRRLQGLPHCKVPLTRRLPANALLAAAGQARLEGFTLPFLVRLTGNHGGDDFAKVNDWAELAHFVQAHGAGNYYITEFVDYRGADGCYRKYRLICIDGEVYPYHLAIHDDWMVHHFRTDMGAQAWKREEEARFLAHPHEVFDAARWAALRAIARAFELDYQGIDCGIDAQGNVLIFEVNATMLVHAEQDPAFAYKNPHVARIKAAFEAMVRQRVAMRTNPQPRAMAAT